VDERRRNDPNETRLSKSNTCSTDIDYRAWVGREFERLNVALQESETKLQRVRDLSSRYHRIEYVPTRLLERALMLDEISRQAVRQPTMAERIERTRRGRHANDPSHGFASRVSEHPQRRQRLTALPLLMGCLTTSCLSLRSSSPRRDQE